MNGTFGAKKAKSCKDSRDEQTNGESTRFLLFRTNSIVSKAGSGREKTGQMYS